MSFSCCSNTKMAQKCRKHSDHVLTLFCSNSNCMEPLCTVCVDGHKQIHHQLNIGEPAIIDLRDVENFILDNTRRQIKFIEQTKDRNNRPTDVLYKGIDRFFYGSTERRENILKNRFKDMAQNYSAHVLIRAIQDDHEYSISRRFKQDYFRFLDELVGTIDRKNELGGYANVVPGNNWRR